MKASAATTTRKAEQVWTFLCQQKPRSWKRHWKKLLPSPASWTRFLAWYEGHKVLTLSLLNALSLFVFASLVLIVWAIRGGEANATSRPGSETSQAAERPLVETSVVATRIAPPRTTPAERRPRPTTAPPSTPDSELPPTRPGESGLGFREYQVEIRRVKRAFSEDAPMPDVLRFSQPVSEDTVIERSQ